MRDARKAMRWSQAELGKRMAQSIGRPLPFSQASVSEFERGAEMPMELLERLPTVFNGLSVPFTFSSYEETALDNKSIDHESWKRANNLRDEFPNLLPLSDDEFDLDRRHRKLYFGRSHVEKINELLARSGGNAPVFVHVNRGHGCSTLSRFTYQWVRHRAQVRQRLPIYLALEELDERKLFTVAHQTIEDALRLGIADGIAHIDWQPLIPETAEPQFGSKPDSLTKDQWDDHKRNALLAYAPLKSKLHRFHAIQASLREIYQSRSNREIAVENLAVAWPALSLPLSDLLIDLQALSLGRILSVELLVDLSSRIAYAENERYDRAIGALQIALKSITSNLTPARLSEVYFGHSQSFEAFKYGWERSAVAVEYPWYRPHDVFGMLAYHYIPSKDDARSSLAETVAASVRDQRELLASVPDTEPSQERIKALSTKMGPEYLTGIVVPELPLTESSRRLKNRLFRSTARRDLLERADQASRIAASRMELSDGQGSA